MWMLSNHLDAGFAAQIFSRLTLLTSSAGFNLRVNYDKLSHKIADTTYSFRTLTKTFLVGGKVFAELPVGTSLKVYVWHHFDSI